MHPKRYALIAGLFFLVLGLMSFIPSFSNDPNGILLPLSLETSHGLFFGLFATNIVNKIALLVFGVAGLWASQATGRELPFSITYAKSVFVVMGMGSILGMIESTRTFFGYWPLYGNEIWFHGISSLIGGYFAFMLPSKIHTDAAIPSVRHLDTNKKYT